MKLKVTTPNATEIHMTREFAAPRALVIRAMTTPELVERWLGGTRAEVVSCEIDFRVGGRYRYAFRNLRDGSTFALTGEYVAIEGDRIVFTESMEGMPGESTVTTTYVEKDGRTTMTVVATYPSREIRDIVLRTGMTDGAGESYDALDELVATL